MRVSFQSTPARGGRHCMLPPCLGSLNSFNPRPRAAGDALLMTRPFASATMFQSTPARGGRRVLIAKRPKSAKVSIHARARRATGVAVCRLRRRTGFNPRPRAAGDLLHRPPRSAPGRSFNPRPRAAGDLLKTMQTVYGAAKFQSTPARGGRHGPADTHAGGESFNPRPRAAGDRPPPL